MELTVEEKRIVDTFYLDPEYEDKESAENFLTEHGYEGGKAKLEFIKMLAEKKAKLALGKGAELQKKFDAALTVNKDDENEADSGIKYKAAARNLGVMTENDKRVNLENLKAINQATKGK